MQMNHVSRRFLNIVPQIFVLSASVLAVFSALVVEYMGYLPCHLCYIERSVYYLLIVLSAISCLYQNIILCSLITIAMIAEFAIAVFHMGLERAWWYYNISCTNNTLAFAENLEQFRQVLNSTQAVSCLEPALVVWGISMVEWNVLYIASMFIIYCGLIYVFKSKKAG
jgi:disulfide bond formation protein DsbB